MKDNTNTHQTSPHNKPSTNINFTWYEVSHKESIPYMISTQDSNTKIPLSTRGRGYSKKK